MVGCLWGAIAPSALQSSGPKPIGPWSLAETVAPVEPTQLLQQLRVYLQRDYRVRIIRDACEVGIDGYYDGRKRRIVVCPQRTRSVLEVVAHESIHVLQDIADGRIGNQFAIPLGWREIQLAAPVEAKLRREHTVTDERQMEREAWWAEVRPQVVLQLLHGGCGLLRPPRQSDQITMRQQRLHACALPSGDLQLGLSKGPIVDKNEWRFELKLRRTTPVSDR